MKRRHLIKTGLAALLLAAVTAPRSLLATRTARADVFSRVRPGQAGWPSAGAWNRLRRRVGDRLLQPASPFLDGPESAAYRVALSRLDNPFALGDDPALTQTSGWFDAWRSRGSAYAVVAETSADVIAAVKFARRHGLRLVVKGGGHSYQGTSQSADSLLVWTRRMNRVTVHEAFVADGCDDTNTAMPAATIQAGALWIDAYHAVTTVGGRYVQGGGCTSVGVAGLVQSGGFGSFSKRFGSVAANLLQARVVTADGVERTVNACRDPELFWAIKGGGGGNLGVVTEVTLRTFELPEWFGAVFGRIQADSDEALRSLVAKAMSFYRDALFNPNWGEQMSLRGGNSLQLSMLFQGIDKAEAQRVWAPFVAWVEAQPGCRFTEPLTVQAVPARHFWDLEFLNRHAPGVMVADDRPEAPVHYGVWAGDRGQIGWFIHAYQSAWLPQSLLAADHQADLVDALVNACRHWDVELHFNKGLAGGDTEAIARSHATATHPQMTDAFALAICAASGAPAFPGMPDSGPDAASIRRRAGSVGQAMSALRRVAPDAGSYVSESDFFLADWQQGFWGANYPRLAQAKRRYDPETLFFTHHGVGSEGWSADGFSRST